MPYETLVYINIVLFVCSSESLSAGHVCVFRSSWEEMTESVPPVLHSSSWGLMCPCSTITSRSSSGSVSRRLSWGGRGWNSATAPPPYVYVHQLVLFLTPWLLGGIGTLLYQLRVLDEAFAGVVSGVLMLGVGATLQGLAWCMAHRTGVVQRLPAANKHPCRWGGGGVYSLCGSWDGTFCGAWEEVYG